MAQTYDSRRLRNERRMDNRLTELHRRMAQQAGVLIVRAADFNGVIPSRRAVRTRLTEAIWEQVVKPFYIGPGVDPFRDAEPRSPYARLLFEGVQSAIRIQAERQAAVVNRVVRDEEVVQWLTGPRGMQPVTEERGAYDAFHLFVDSNGYRLSDRVWRAGVNVRANIDRLVAYHISQGTSAVRMAELLEDYLTPGAKLIRTRTPYGVEGAYAARRLARTEITAAAGRGTVNAAIANPFVQGVQWSLSRAHRCCDICDDYARGGENGDGIYPPDRVPAYPAHPHDMCTLVPVPMGTSAELVETLRVDIQAARGRLLTAAAAGGNVTRARALQGLLNPDYLVRAILDGSIEDAIHAAQQATRELV